jgi:hypothetical protein
LDDLNVGVVGVFIAPTTKLDRWWRLSVVWCTGQSGAHRTCPVRQPRHQYRWIPTVGASVFWARLDVRCTPDMYCSMSGARVWACLTSARFWRALNAPAGDRWREVVVALLVHRTVRCTPDMSGAPATSPKPLDSDCWSSDFWARLDVRCTPDMHCSMSGAPVWACLPSARFWRALNAPAGDRWREVAVALLVHRTVRCTPDMSGEL